MSIDDILFIFKSNVKRHNCWRLFGCYLRLSLKRFLSHWLKFDQERFLGFKIKVLSYRSFYAMFRDIFVKNNYYFETNEPKPVIIDGGANIGLATLYFKYLYPNSKII